jgi:hypothetical protein
MVASAAQIRVGKTDSAQKAMRFTDQEWQREAWRLYDIIGELRFVSNWVGAAISRCRLYVAEVDDSGENRVEVADGDIAALAAVPLGVGPAKDENLRLLGINLFVAGEAFVVGRGIDDAWFVVSGSEIDQTGDIIQVPLPRRLGGGKMTVTDGSDVLVRVWTPHPRQVDQPDSPTRAAIPILRELELLSKREFAELDSRLTGAGVWPLAQGMEFPHADGAPEGLAGFMQLLAKAAETSINNQSSAEAMLPIMVTVPDQVLEHLDKMVPINFWSDLSEQIPTMKDAAIKRLALALDIPAEILMGVGSSNRWNAWLADEQVVKIHVEPPLSRIADALAIGYLSGALEDLDEDPDAFTYAFDTAPLTVRPNRTTDALEFWDRNLVTDDEAMTAGAFSSAVDMKERMRRIAEAAVKRDPSLLADVAIQAMLGWEGQFPDNGTPAGRPPEIEADEPEQPRALPQSEKDRPSNSDEDSEASIMPAVTLAVVRALELAGGRLTTPADRRNRWPQVPRHQLHTKVGSVTPQVADRVLAGAWSYSVPFMSDCFGLDSLGLAKVLHGYCFELLTRGVAHDDDLLQAAMMVAVAGRRNGRR